MSEIPELDLAAKTVIPKIDSGKVIDNSAANLNRAKTAIGRLEFALAETITLDNNINVSAQNKEFDRACDLLEEARRLKSLEDAAPSAKTAEQAMLIADAALTDLNRVLREDAQSRFESVERYMVEHVAYKIDDLAKLKLESARYILNTMNPFEVLKKALNNLTTINLLIEAHAIAFHNIRYGQPSIVDETGGKVSTGASSSATLRWIAA